MQFLTYLHRFGGIDIPIPPVFTPLDLKGEAPKNKYNGTSIRNVSNERKVETVEGRKKGEGFGRSLN